MAAGVLGLGLFFAAPAEAKPVEKGHYSGSDAFDEEICGLEVHLEVTFRGSFHTLPVKGTGGQAFFAHDNYEFREMITVVGGDPATFVTTHGNGVFHEQHATPRPDEGPYVYEFEAIDAGTFTLRDSSGKVLVRDRGVVQLTAVFDTLGDSQPGGVLISEDVVFRGPHSDDETFCAAFVGALT
jgi:hypothetical protein